MDLRQPRGIHVAWRPRLLASLVVLVALALLVRDVEWPRLWATFRSAAWPLVLLAAVLNLALNGAARVLRFSALLGFLVGRGTWGTAIVCGPTVLVTRALNSVLPGRAGEAFRIVHLQRRLSLPVETVVAAVVAEPLVEGLSLALPGALLLAVLPASAPFVRGLALFVALVAAGLLLLAIGGRARKGKRHGPARGRFLARVLAALTRFASLRVWLGALLWATLSDAVDVAMIALCLAAVGAPLGLVQWVLVLLVVNVAILVPSPGNLGTLEAGAVVALLFLGVERPTGLAFALLYHAAHLFPVLLAGLAGAWAVARRAPSPGLVRDGCDPIC